MRFSVISLFPEMFAAISDYGITRRALEAGVIGLDCWNPRDYTTDKHRTVDDRPFGGGPGMVMMAEPLAAAVTAAKQALPDECKPLTVYLSPQGKTLNQAAVTRLAEQQAIIMVAGRYEGIDERFIDTYIDEEWSIGDYVLSGGELAAMVMVDSITRLLPGALGHQESAVQDSFSGRGLLDCPHYTRPEEWQGMKVPTVLRSGNHAAIENWRLQQSLGRTYQRRPELLGTDDAELSGEEKALLQAYLQNIQTQESE